MLQFMVSVSNCGQFFPFFEVPCSLVNPGIGSRTRSGSGSRLRIQDSQFNGKNLIRTGIKMGRRIRIGIRKRCNCMIPGMGKTWELNEEIKDYAVSRIKSINIVCKKNSLRVFKRRYFTWEIQHRKAGQWVQHSPWADYDELMASHAAVGESPNDPDSPQGDGDTLPYRWVL